MLTVYIFVRREEFWYFLKKNLYASPPMANMILVPFGTAPFSPEPLVFASVAMAGGTAGILYGLRNVRKIVLDPICWYGNSCGVQTRSES